VGDPVARLSSFFVPSLLTLPDRSRAWAVLDLGAIS
jgi:hypothetical protein